MIRQENKISFVRAVRINGVITTIYEVWKLL